MFLCWCVITQEPTSRVSATSATTVHNIITTTQSAPVGNDRLFKDIVSEKDLHALITANFSSDEDRDWKHFILTPIDVIDQG